MKRKKLLSFAICVALILSMLTPALAVVDSDAQKPLLPKDSLAKTEPSVASPHETVTSGGKTFSVKVTMDTPFQPKLVITASGLDNTTINAAILDVKSFVGGTLGGVVTNFTDSTRFTNPAGAGLAEMSDYHYNVSGKFVDGSATIGVGNFVAGKGQANLCAIAINSTNSTDLSTNGDKGTAFYRSYVFIVQSAQLGGNSATDYAVGTFVMDSEGKLLDASYMVRYIKNSNSAGNDSGNGSVGSIPANQIVVWNTAATLYETVPTRKGYDFLGWNHDGTVMGTDANAAAAMTPTLDFFKTTTPKTLLASTAGATGAFIDVGNVIYDLYAIWRPIKVDFHADTATLPKSDSQKLKVNVPYAQPYTLAAGTSPDTSKSYTVTSEQKLPKGLTVAQVSNTTWKISGTPEVYTATSLVVTIKVTDTVNKTWDELTLTIPPIDKGAQEVVPDLDVTTGLESDVIQGNPDGEPPTADDGILRGFYALGQEDPNADGTGSLRPYYLDVTDTWNEALIYEYKPTGDSAVAWREIPLPKEYYKAEDLAGLALSMAANATATSTSVLARGKTQATVTTGTGTAWGNEYGSIVFDDEGNPTLHGLTPDATYEVRFKENSDYGASAAQPITITAGGGGGGATESGYSVLFNLMGGKVFKTEITPESAKVDVTGSDDDPFAKALTSTDPNGTIRIPSLLNGITLEKEDATFLGFTDGSQLGTTESPYLQPGDEYPLPGYTIGLAAVWSSGPGNYIPVVCFDWDGRTLLGAVLVDKTDTEANIRASVDEFTAALMPEGVYGAAYDSAKDYYDAAYPLTDKNGYSFDRWMDFDSDAYTSFGEAVSIGSYFTMGEPIQAPDLFSLEQVKTSTSITVKAAYKTNTKLDKDSALYTLEGGLTPEKRQYTVEGDSFNRFDATSNYSIKVRITRNNEDGVPVYRVREMGIKISMTVPTTGGGTTTLYALQRLDNVDDQVTEIAVNSDAVLNMSVAVVDLGDVENWASGTTARSNSYGIALGDTDPGTDGCGNGYLLKGCLGQLNGMARRFLETEPTSQDIGSNIYFTTAGFNVSSVAGTTGGAAARRLQALKNIITMYKSVLENEGVERDLDWYEMDSAIRDGATYPSYVHP